MVASSFRMAATVLVVATAFGSPGIARAGLVSSTPEANATVTQGAAVGPQINLHFSEKIDLSRSTFAVIGPRGRMMTTVGQDVNDKTVVFVSLWNQVLSGKYTIRWQTVSTGRQRSHGSFTFTVKLGR